MIREPDANTAALNKYLSDLDRDERRAEAIQARAEELLAGEYHPLSFEAISEAIGEASAEHQAVITTAAKANDLAALGAAVLAASTTYWTALATSTAETDVDDNWRSCSCHGRGCRRCHEPDEETLQ